MIVKFWKLIRTTVSVEFTDSLLNTNTKTSAPVVPGDKEATGTLTIDYTTVALDSVLTANIDLIFDDDFHES